MPIHSQSPYLGSQAKSALRGLISRKVDFGDCLARNAIATPARVGRDHFKGVR